MTAKSCSSKSSNESSGKLRAVIAGAGPAGLTAAWELLERTDIKPFVCESTQAIGGISRTVVHNGNRMDIGGHRFFSKSQRVTDWWTARMPGKDPAKEDRTLMIRPRVSRIYYLRRFFDYPVTLSLRTLRNLGLGRTLSAGFGFMKASVRKLPETSLENFYINRFGRTLYKLFFESYTEKVWGIHPSKLGADWGSQRVKGLSITAILKDMIAKKFGSKKNDSNVETSLIESFIYPKYGPGQLWEAVTYDIRETGGDIQTLAKVTEVNIDAATRRVVSVTVENQSDDSRNTEGKACVKQIIPCDYFLSSMPLCDLIAAIRGIEVPEEVATIARTLPYRDFITVGLLVDRLAIENTTKLETYRNRIPDTWIYVQERDVKLGRIQVFNNWSPYMVKDYENTMWIGLEYFCNEGDTMWEMSDNDFIKMAVGELKQIGIIAPETQILDSLREKVRKAYPAYYGSYYQLGKVRDFLDTIPNLFCIGRNGQHRYNNMDHSMLTAMESVDIISRELDGSGHLSHDPVWQVNTEADYHESKS